MSEPEESPAAGPAEQAPQDGAAAPAQAFEPPPPPPSTEAPADADALRGYHFKLLLANPWTWTILGVITIAVGVAAAAATKSGGVGVVAAAGAFAISLIAVFAMADARSADSFFDAYAQARGLTLMSGRSRMPPTTPLLQKGDDRYADRLMEGPLAEGTEGKLATFTYEKKSSAASNRDETNYYRYTLGYLEVPECIQFIPELFVRRRSGPRSLEKLEDVFSGAKQRVKFESEVFEGKYEVFVSEMQDPNWVHRLFSPVFIVWMIDSAPEKLAFELFGGNLCCYVNGHHETADALDGIASATAAIAKRLRDESLE